MENNRNSIHLRQVFLLLLKRAWVILLVTVVAAAIGFGLGSFLMPPAYEAQVLLLVDNRGGEDSYSISQMDAARDLTVTFAELLKSPGMLSNVIQQAGAFCTPRQLERWLLAEPVEDTPLLRVTIRAQEPKQSEDLVKAVAQRLPQQAQTLLPGVKLTVADLVLPEGQPSGTEALGLAMAGAWFGLAVSVVAVVALELYKKKV